VHVVSEWIFFFFFGGDAVAKDIYAEEDSVITRMLQALAIPILGNVCHVCMHGLKRVPVSPHL